METKNISVILRMASTYFKFIFTYRVSFLFKKLSKLQSPKISTSSSSVISYLITYKGYKINAVNCN